MRGDEITGNLYCMAESRDAKPGSAPDVPGCLTAPFGCLVNGCLEMVVVWPLSAGLAYLVMTRVLRRPLDSPGAWIVSLVAFVIVGVALTALVVAVMDRFGAQREEDHPRRRHLPLPTDEDAQ